MTDTGYSYDDAGNPTTYGGVSATWDVRNKLTAFGSALTAGYRCDGRRAWKANSSSVKTYFLYLSGQPVIEMDSSGTVTAVNTFGCDGLVSRHTSSGSVFYTFTDGGDVAQRLDGSGSVLGAYAYSAYGTLISSSTSSANPDLWGYKGSVGYYTDSETGLILCGHRYYDASVGRWLNRDPIGYSGGINLYAYCADNAVMGADPSGFKPVLEHICDDDGDGGDGSGNPNPPETDPNKDRDIIQAREQASFLMTAMAPEPADSLEVDAAEAAVPAVREIVTEAVPAIKETVQGLAQEAEEYWVVGRTWDTEVLVGEPGYNVLKVDNWHCRLQTYICCYFCELAKEPSAGYRSGDQTSRKPLRVRAREHPADVSALFYPIFSPRDRRRADPASLTKPQILG